MTTVTLVYAFAALIALLAGAVMWGRRDAAGAKPLTAVMLAAAFWALADAVELHMPTVAGKQLISQIQYLGVVSAAPFFVHAALALAGRAAQLSRGAYAAIWTIPLLSLLLAWTNSWHGLIWTRILPPAGDSPFATYEYGWWFWMLAAQNYLLMVTATVVLLGAIRRVGHGFRTGMALVIAAVVLPWLGNAAYNLKLGPWPGLNWLTLSLGASGWLLIWVVLHEGLLDLLPRARGVLIEMMADGVIVLDRRGAVIYSNQSARETMKLDAASLADALGVATLKQAPVEWRGEAFVEGAAERRWLDVRVSPVLDRWNELAGRIIVARDVTAHKALEDEREHLIDELQESVRKVTTLEGMLPICAHCRNVRDDHGLWSRIEDYIESRTPLEFTHAICPACMARLYPDAQRGGGRR